MTQDTPKSKTQLIAELQDLRARFALEQKLSEEVLAYERQFLRAILDTLPISVYIKDLQGRKTLSNRADLEIIGRPEAEVLGKTDAELFPPDMANHFWQDDQSVFTSGQAVQNREELVFNQSQGRQFWQLTSKAPLCDASGKLIGLVGFGLDITERKTNEQVLEINNAQMNALLSAMTELVVLHEIVFDEHGNPLNYRIIDCNAAYTKDTGIAREDSIGKLATDVYQSAEPPYFEEYCHVALTGEPLQMETYYAPMDKYFSISVVSPGKNRFATITTNITAIKQSQKMIEAKNKELEQIIYVTSHDLRSPLVNVDGYSREIEFSLKSIRESAANSATLLETLRLELPEMEAALTRIRSSAQQMDGLLKGLLKLSRSGRASLNICALDMNALIAKVCSGLDYHAKVIGAQIQVAELPPCLGDSVQVTQVFTNLLDNALKYLDPNRPGAITISGHVEFKKATYCVEDNGIGISEAHIENIFELFHRLNPRQTDGDGLGLTIVRQALARMGGEVTVESQVGQGSRFYVKLPLAQ